jgi:His-Xaa-Ser system protein HxsD
MDCSTDIDQQRVSFEVGDAIDEEAVLAAAHAFSSRVEVWETDDGVELEAKGDSKLDEAGLRALAAEFSEELVAQELRRRIAAENRSVREYLITQALLAAANEQGRQPADSQLGNLSGDQEDEIQRLIQEAEEELSGGRPDSGGRNATPGGEGGEGQDEPLDPKDILKSWEEKSGA